MEAARDWPNFFIIIKKSTAGSRRRLLEIRRRFKRLRQTRIIYNEETTNVRDIFDAYIYILPPLEKKHRRLR